MQCGQYAGRHSDAKDDADDDASLGTKLHVRTQGLFRVERVDDDLSPADVEDCDWAAEQVRAIFDRTAPGAVVTIERELRLLDDDGQEVTFGTADFFACGEDLVVVPDLKGCLDYKPDDHYYEPQVACYALMGMREYGKQKAYCPIVNIKPHKVVDYWLEYDHAAAIVEAAIRNKGTQARPCFACKLCGKLTTCPAVNSIVEQLAPVLPATEDYLIDIIAQPVEGITDPAVMACAYQLSKIVKKWADAVKDAALTMSETTEVPYHERKSKLGRRTCTNIAEAFNRLGLPEADFQMALSLSLDTVAEKYAVAHGMTIKAAKDHTAGLLDDIIERGESSYSLELVKKGRGR